MRATLALLLAGLLAGPPLAARAADSQAKPVATAAAKANAKPAATPAPKAAPKRFVIHTVGGGATHHTVLANVHYRLKNGLKVILYEDPRQPRVRVSVWYHSGSCNEKHGLHGMAHLFEHLMFEGSAHLGQSVLGGLTDHRQGTSGQPGIYGTRDGSAQGADASGFIHVSFGVFTYLQYAGATDVDAETGFEHTRFFETVPPSNLEIALWLESDRMGFLDAFKQKRLDKQRHIVDNELRQRIQTTPYVGSIIKRWPKLWPKDHPCRVFKTGSIKALSRVTIKDMREYYEPAYAPGDAVLVLAGALPKNTKKLIAKYFGTLPARTPMPRIHYQPVKLTHEIDVSTHDPLAATPLVMLSWHAAPILTHGDAVAQLTAEILSGSRDTRLEQALVDTHLAADAGADLQEFGFGSIFSIEATPRDGVPAKKVVAAIDKVLDGLRTPVSKDELDRARMRLETERMRGLQGLDAKATLLQTYTQFTGNPDGFYADLSRYEHVTPQDVADFVAHNLGPNQRVRLVVHPGARTGHPKASKSPAVASAKPATPSQKEAR